MQLNHSFHPSIVRAYDIRGVVDDTFTEQDCFWFARGFATHVAETINHPYPRITIVRDGRVSSQRLMRALAQGLKASGAHVYNGGIGPTPMGYFSAFRHEVNAVLVVTGSHNPPTHNGIKSMLGLHSFYGDALKSVAARAENCSLLKGRGQETEIALESDYVRTLIATAGSTLTARPLTVVWDAGNGAAGPVVEQIASALPEHRHGLMFTRIDGHFPNHHPDPSDPKNMVQLSEAVVGSKADIGLALDGDGDRLGVVDDKGRLVSPDHLLMLFADDVLAYTPAATIVADVKTSDAVFDRITKAGGTAVMHNTGHAHIKARMRELDAAFGGEASGHIFFADRYFGFDDGLYAALRMLAILASRGEPLSARIDALPVLYGSPEIRIECDDAVKFERIAALQQSLASEGAEMNTLDGVRVRVKDGWWLLRASNTQPALVGRAEAKDEESLENVMRSLREAITRVGLSLG
jgi:phosphomannomutase